MDSNHQPPDQQATSHGTHEPSLAGASYNLLGPGPTLATVVDNGAYDADTIPGTITLMNVAGGKWSVCQAKVPYGYELAHPACAWWQVYSNATTTATYFSPPFLSASWDVRDWYGALMFPSAFAVTGPRGLGKFAVSDNGAWDRPSYPSSRRRHLVVEDESATIRFPLSGALTAGLYRVKYLTGAGA